MILEMKTSFDMEIYYGMEMNFGMKIVNAYILSGLFLPLAFGIGITIHLQSADLYLQYDWLDMKWFDEFVMFSSGGDPISSTCKLLTSEWKKS